jgi:hypothetical protein
MGAVRDAFHAFSLGDAPLARKAAGLAAEFDESVRRLRSRLIFTSGRTARRGKSELMDFVTVAGRVLRSALEVARGDAEFRARLSNKEREDVL